MLNIHIIAVGKLKEEYWKQAEAEYLKRLSPYAKISITEIKEEPFASEHDRERIQKKEAEKIQALFQPGDTVLALHERGQEYTSPELAALLEKQSERGSRLTIVIGGPLGLAPALLESIPISLSLSQLTFPHQMVRTILLEQLYRAVTIQKQKPYHY